MSLELWCKGHDETFSVERETYARLSVFGDLLCVEFHAELHIQGRTQTPKEACPAM